MSLNWYRGVCPNCGNAEVEQHSKSVWCLRCGWGRNREADPSTGRPTALGGLLGNPDKH